MAEPNQVDKSEGDQNYGPPTVEVEPHGRGKYRIAIYAFVNGTYLGAVFVKEDRIHEDSTVEVCTDGG